MSRFSEGFLLGYLFSSDSENEGSGGCLKLILGVLGLIAVVFGLGFAILAGNKFIGIIRGFFESIYEFSISKILFFPSSFDVTLSILSSSPFKKVVLLTVALIILMLLVGKISNNQNLLFISLGFIGLINTLILIVRIIYYIGVSILILFVGSENYNPEYSLNEDIKFNIMDNTHDVRSKYYQSEEAEMPDITLDVHKNLFWLDFDNEGKASETARLKTELGISGVLFNDVKSADEFNTIVSYFPLDDSSTHTNLSEFSIEFYGDGDLLERVELNPNNQLEKINISINKVSKFEILIESNMKDRSIVGFYDPYFLKFK